MKTSLFSITILVALSATNASAQTASPSCDWDARTNAAVWGKCPAKGETPAPVVNVDRAADDHARRTYDRLTKEGGCNADVLPVEYAAYCLNGAINSANKLGPVGASSGGSGE